MQQWCKAKKKEDKALQLCLLRKSPVPPQPVQCKVFTPAASQVLQFKVPKRMKP